MTQDLLFITKTKELIDSLKSVCANYGLGNDGNEFKIINQVFLYKFRNYSGHCMMNHPKVGL